jgi:arginyl-tRNA synthetase
VTQPDPLAALRIALDEAAGAFGAPKSAPTLERPKQAGHGDYSTNAALLLAPGAGRPPRELAESLAVALRERLGEDVRGAEVAGPGFVNLVMADGWYGRALRHVLAAGEGFGGGVAGAAQRIDVEFVSANPTGPMHVGHARNAAYGDAVSRILAFHGHDVTREFYVNDHGTQIVKLGASIIARAHGEQPPEGGYVGDYVNDLVALAEGRDDPAEVGLAAVGENVERMKRSLERFGVAPFEVWTSERALHLDGRVAEALAALRERGETYESEGATWLRTSARGDDKDRVLVRRTGDHTYFTSDLGYLLDKRARGFDRLLIVLGADHHGYQGRMKAAYGSLGGDPDALELLIMQFVHLVEGGARAAMSKRAGEFVTLDELVAEIGVDAARWFLLARSHDTTIDLDLDLAREQSAENPVYYVQYAHARIASVLEKAGGERVQRALDAVADGAVAAGLEGAERALVKRLLAFPAEVADAAERRAPHRVATYALELAQDFTAFYRDCRVVGAQPPELESFRIALAVAAKRTIATALGLLGVGAPDSM